ncbi:hypothetical protein ACH5RR_012720 [Cinchona calisaya]|uniref:Uncharacterized protein n=1 Tax=Cinchona calisaya TaxID=153742 RepID=A0ABD3AA12_9GENT
MVIIDLEVLIQGAPSSKISLEKLSQYVVTPFNAFCLHVSFFLMLILTSHLSFFLILSFQFDDHEQPMKFVDDTLEEMEVSVTWPRKFDVLSNVIHSSSNANLTKNFEDKWNDSTKSQTGTQMEKTTMAQRTLPIQTTSLGEQPLKIFKPPT